MPDMYPEKKVRRSLIADTFEKLVNEPVKVVKKIRF